MPGADVPPAGRLTAAELATTIAVQQSVVAGRLVPGVLQRTRVLAALVELRDTRAAATVSDDAAPSMERFALASIARSVAAAFCGGLVLVAGGPGWAGVMTAAIVAVLYPAAW